GIRLLEPLHTIMFTVLYDAAHIFLLLSARTSPRFTLFPYTTLFRSYFCCWSICLSPLAEGSIGASIAASIRPGEGLVAALSNCGDRKSTRLNSSHVKISYADFCLKKKKK